MSQSNVGEAWKTYLQGEKLSWCDPDAIEPDSFVRHIRSEWIQRLLRSARIEPGPGVRVLEAGCGTGMYSLSLAILGFDVDAFDYNEEALAIARKLESQARRVREDLKIRFHRGDILNIDAESDTFHLVFNQGVLEYFGEGDQQAVALAEMARVTRPGGRIVVIDQHTGHPLRRYWERLGWQGYTNQPPVGICSPSSLASALRSAGLINIEIDGIYPWKCLFWYPAWHKRWRLTSEAVYLAGRALEHVPLPQAWRATLGLQILGAGTKS